MQEDRSGVAARGIGGKGREKKIYAGRAVGGGKKDKNG